MEVKARLSLLDTIRQKHSVAMEFINNLDEALLNKKKFETTLNNMVESATELAKTAIAFPDLNLSENDILGALNSFVTDLEHQPRAMVMHMPVKGAEEKTVLPMPPTVGKTTETSETEVVRREPSAFPPSISIPKLSTSSSSLFGGSSSNSTAANTPDLPRKPLLSTILEPSDSDDEFSISDPTEQGNNAAGKTPPPSPPNTPSNKSFRI
jgi:hypothetical protein